MKINNVYLRLFLFMGVFVGVLFFGKLNTQAIAIAGDSNDELNYEVTSVKVENDTTLVVEGWFYVSFRPYNGTSGNYGYTLQLYEGGKSYPNSDDKPYVDHTSLNSGALGETLPYRNVGFKFKVPLQELIDTGKSTFNLILTHTYKGKADIKRKLAYINDVSSISTKAYSVEFIKSTLSDKLQVDLSHVYARTDQSKGSNLVYINGYGPYYYINDTDFKLGETIWKKSLDKDYSSWFETKTVTGPDTPDTDDTGRMLKRLYPSTKGSRGRYVSGVALNATLNDFKFRVSRKKYTYTFNANGGNYSGSKTMAKVYGIPFVFENVTPTRTGYTFRGWKAVHNGKEYSPSTGWDTYPGKRVPHLPSNNITWYAQWEINTYRFDLNATLDGGTKIKNLGNFGTADVYINGVLKGNDISDWCTNYDYNTKIVIKDIKANPGYTYKGSSSYSYTLGSSTELVLPYITNTYTVKYHGNGNTGGTTPNSSHKYDSVSKLSVNGFTKTGYEFVSWNTKADGSGTSYASGQTVKNLTSTNKGVINLYAQWRAKKYTVTIKPNRGILKGTNFGTSNNTSNDAKVTVTYDSTNYWSLGTASRKHYTFLGFYTSYDKNNANVNGVGTKVWDSAGKSTVSKYFNANKVWKYDGNLTVYANWYNYNPTITQPILPSNNSTVEVPSNIPPFISGGAVVIQKGDPFNPNRFFDYSDKETPKNELKVTIKNPVPTDSRGNTTTRGTYTVVVTVTDGAGASVSTNLKVIVNDPPVLKAKDRWFYTGETVGVSQILEKVTATDYEDGNIKSKVKIVSIKDVNGTNTGSTTKIDTSKIGKYVVTYEVTDNYKKSVTTTATFNVTTLDTDTPSSWYDIRYISKKYLGTVEGQWSSGTLFNRLKNSLNKSATDSNALYVIEMDSNTVENMKQYIVGELSSGNSNRILNLNDNIYSKYESIFKKKPANGGTRKY